MLNNLIEQRGRLYQQAQDLTKGKTSIDSETRAKVTALLTDADQLDVDIKNMKAIAEFESEQRNASKPIRSNPSADINGNDSKDAETRGKAALHQWIRTGSTSEENRAFLKAEHEARDLGVGAIATPITGGSVLVPQTIDTILHQTKRSNGNYLGFLRQFNTSGGGPLQVSLSDDVTAKATIIGEAVAVSELDPSVSGFVSNTSALSSGLVKVSYELLQDSQWDVQGWLTDVLNQRMLRGISSYVTTGGTNFASLPAAAHTVTSAAGDVTAATYADVLAVYSALDPIHLETSSWVMSNTTRIAFMLGLTDTLTRPLIQTAGVDNVQTLFNRPILVNPYADTFLANKIPVLFGDLEASYTLRNVIGGTSIQRLNERYSDTREVGFIMFSRGAGYATVQASSPSLVGLKMAAS